MKKRNLYILGGFLTLLLATGCDKDNYVQTDFSHPIGGNQIALSCQSDLDGDKSIWMADSKIGFFCDQTESKNVAVGVAAPFVGKAEGLFYTHIAWNEDGGDHLLYAYTPYNKDNVSYKSIAGMLSNSQTQFGTSRNHLSTMAVTYDKVKTAATQPPVPMHFKHALGYVDFCCSTQQTFVGWKIKSITWSVDEELFLAGKYLLDLSQERLSISEGMNEIMLRVDKAPSLGANSPFHGYMAVNPIDLSGKQSSVKLVIEKAGEHDRQLIGKVDGMHIEAGQMNKLSIQMDEMDSEYLGDWSIDLSKTETANCYIAGKPGQEYRFKATVMGNGAITPAQKGKNNFKGITPTPLQPVSASILWQTERSLLTGVKLKNDYVYFTLNGSKETPLIPGNAVIAVYDASGTILWSWHIWVTDVDLDAKAQTYSVIHNDYSLFPQFQSPIVMDRNLGATDNQLWKSATDPKSSHGLFYQWGRKDPIVGPSTESANAFASVYDANNRLVYFDLSATEPISRTDIAKYPMRYIKGNNWFAEDAYDLWGYSSVYQSNGGDGTIGKKSIYDPCPPGYCVPHPFIWSGFTSNPTGGKHANGSVTTTASGDITKQGGVVFDNGGPVIYPSTGFINNGSLQRVAPAKNGCISLWSNAPAKSNFSSQFYYDATNCNTPKANKRTFGFGVRCIKYHLK